MRVIGGNDDAFRRSVAGRYTSGINQERITQVPAYGINMVCGSGMKAIMNGYNDILVCGDADIVIAGVPVYVKCRFILGGNLRSGAKMGNLQAVDHMVL